MKLTTATWMFLDTETTGLKPEEGARVIEFGAVFVKDGQLTDESLDFLINPEAPIPAHITKITGISDRDVAGKPPFRDMAERLLQCFRQSEFVAAYNKDFDRKMIESEFSKLGMKMPNVIWLDPLNWARKFMESADNKLVTIAQDLKINLSRAHRADADARAGAEALLKLFDWGADIANFPDSVEELKSLEHSWRSEYQAKSRIMKPLKDPDTGKIKLTGEPGKYAQNVYDNYNRERLFKLNNRGRWGK